MYRSPLTPVDVRVCRDLWDLVTEAERIFPSAMRIVGRIVRFRLNIFYRWRASAILLAAQEGVDIETTATDGVGNTQPRPSASTLVSATVRAVALWLEAARQSDLYPAAETSRANVRYWTKTVNRRIGKAFLSRGEGKSIRDAESAVDAWIQRTALPVLRSRSGQVVFANARPVDEFYVREMQSHIYPFRLLPRRRSGGSSQTSTKKRRIEGEEDADDNSSDNGDKMEDTISETELNQMIDSSSKDLETTHKKLLDQLEKLYIVYEEIKQRLETAKKNEENIEVLNVIVTHIGGVLEKIRQTQGKSSTEDGSALSETEASRKKTDVVQQLELLDANLVLQEETLKKLLVEVVGTFGDDLIKLNSVCRSLQVELEERKQQLKGAADELSKANQEIARLQSEIVNHKKEVTALNELKESLRIIIAGKDSEINNLNELLKNHEVNWINAFAQYSQLGELTGQLITENINREEWQKKSDQHIQWVQKRIAELEGIIIQKNIDVSQLEQKIASSEATNNQLVARNKELDGHLTASSKQVTGLLHERSLRDATFSAEMVSRDKEIESLNLELRTSNEKNTRFKEENENLQKQNNKLTAEIQLIQEISAFQQARIAALELEVGEKNRLHAELGALNEKLETLKQNLEDVESKYDEAINNIAKQKNENETLRKNAETLQLENTNHDARIREIYKKIYEISNFIVNKDFSSPENRIDETTQNVYDSIEKTLIELRTSLLSNQSFDASIVGNLGEKITEHSNSVEGIVNSHTASRAFGLHGTEVQHVSPITDINGTDEAIVLFDTYMSEVFASRHNEQKRYKSLKKNVKEKFRTMIKEKKIFTSETVDALQKSLNDKMTEINELSLSNKKFKKQMETVTGDLLSLKQQIRTLTEELTKSNEKNKTNETHIKDLQRFLDEKTQELDALKQKKDEELDALKKEKKDELDALKKEKKDELDALKQETKKKLDELGEEKTNREKEYNELRVQFTVLKHQKEKMDETLKALEAERNKLIIEKDNVTSEYKNYYIHNENENKSLKAQNETLTRAAEEKDAKIRKLEEDINERLREKETMDLKMEELNKNIEKLKEDNDVRETGLRELQALFEEEQRKALAGEQQMEEMKSSFEHKQAEIESLLREVENNSSEYIKRLKDIETSYEKALKDIAEKDVEIEKLQGDKAKFLSQISDLKKEHEETLKYLNDIKKQNTALKALFHEWGSELDRLEQQLVDLQNNYDRNDKLLSSLNYARTSQLYLKIAKYATEPEFHTLFMNFMKTQDSPYRTEDNDTFDLLSLLGMYYEDKFELNHTLDALLIRSMMNFSKKPFHKRKNEFPLIRMTMKVLDVDVFRNERNMKALLRKRSEEHADLSHTEKMVMRLYPLLFANGFWSGTVQRILLRIRHYFGSRWGKKGARTRRRGASSSK